MAIAIFVNSMTSLQSDSQQSRPDLRRATYIHISDLTSAYNIDHARLEEELARVKFESEVASRSTESEAASRSTENEDDPCGSSASDADSTAIPLPQKRLQPPRGGYNLCVLVGKVNVVVDKRRVDQSRVRLAEVEIGDETGTVSLRARDDQIDILEDISKRSGAVVLRNCTLELYQGKHIRLAVTKWGKLGTYPDNVASTPPIPSKMNFDRNFSLIDLSLVASEMVGSSHSNPSHLYMNRPANQADSSDAQGARTGHAKSGGPTHRQHQQPKQTQAPNRRGTRGGDRRQPRGKQAPSGGSPAPGRYGGSPEGGAQPLPGQIRYQGMHGYSGYDQAMGVRQYPYSQTQQQEVLSQASQQQMLLLQQQYEMQQRQLHQMYHHGQQERHRPNIGQGQRMQPPTMLMPPTVVGSASFESHGDYTVSSYATGGSEQYPPALNVGSGPRLVPMSMPGGPAPAGVALGANHDQQQMAHHQEGSYASAVQREGYSHQIGTHPSLPTASESALGKMNPQATAFAPASYMNPSANHQHHFPFDPPYHRPTSQHPTTYASAMMYAPASGAAKPSQGSQEPPSVASTPGPSYATTDSQASGKENLQSRPSV